MHQVYHSEVCERVPLLACFFEIAKLVKVVKAWVRSSFGNVLSFYFLLGIQHGN